MKIMDINQITENSMVIVQKGSYLKSCKVSMERPFKLGKWSDTQTVNLADAVGCPYGSTFKMIKKGKKIMNLEKVDGSVNTIDIDMASGQDNRTIFDDGTSQKLSKEEIKNLVNSGISNDEVIHTIASNNSTFTSKTKYSQEKYISKKQRKYDEYITIHRPTVRLIARMMYQEPMKIANLRLDLLSQMLCYSNVSPGSKCLVFESGTLSLVTAAVLKRIGVGEIVHVYPGEWPRKEAIEQMGFSSEALLSISFIGANNLPDFTSPQAVQELEDITKEEELFQVEKAKKLLEKAENEGPDQPPTKIRNSKFKRTRVEDVLRSCKLLSQGVDSLLIASKPCASDVTLALLEYLRPGRNFAIYSMHREFLLRLFPLLKAKSCVNVQLYESFLRNYQVLPERTHPEIIMADGGGYLLTGTKVNDEISRESTDKVLSEENPVLSVENTVLSVENTVLSVADTVLSVANTVLSVENTVLSVADAVESSDSMEIGNRSSNVSEVPDNESVSLT